MGMAISWHGRRRRHAQGRGFFRWLSWLLMAVKPRQFAADDEPPQASVTTTGSHDAEFEAFFLRYDRQITSYLWRLTGDEQSASELAQETFLRAWQHFDTISHYEQPIAWLFRVATNLARQHHRRQTAPVGMATPLDAEAEPASSDPALHIVEQDLVRQTLLQLSFQQRAALVLREVHGMSCAEIAQLLGMSPAAAKMALWRAREQFRQRYLREEEGEA